MPDKVGVEVQQQPSESGKLAVAMIGLKGKSPVVVGPDGPAAPCRLAHVLTQE
jgi:hypothetical protein